MTETKMELEDWLDDLCVRFIINLPREELESVERICFQVEEAQWFYEDFIRPLDPALPSLSLKAFALRIFQHCPLMSQWSHYHHITAFSEFLAYKTRVPVRGAIMLSQDMDEVVLVKGWKKGANWSFPRGKINKDEKDLDCAIREVYEETGYDINEAELVQHEKDVKFIEITMREQHMRLYVFRGVPRDAYFEPRTRKEISKIEWYKLSELPTLKKSKQQDQGFAVANANKFYMVAPFMHPLKKWIAQQKKLDVKSNIGVNQTLPHEGEMSMDEGILATNHPMGMATPSDLPEVAPSHDASAHLKRLLNISNGAATQSPVPSVETLPTSTLNASKSNALLELLRSGSSREPTPQLSGNEQASPPHAVVGAGPPQPQSHQDLPLFPGFPLQGQSSQGGAVSPFPLRQQPAASQVINPHGPAAVYRGVPSYTPQQAPPQPYHGRNLRPEPYATPPPNNMHAAPYQRTGDPFSQPAQPPQIQGASVPPASKLPPPKLTSHSLALLNVFKEKTPKSAHASLVPQQQTVATNGRRSSQHQDQLLNLLKGSPATPSSTPAELAGHATSPSRKQILQRPRDAASVQQTTPHASVPPRGEPLHSTAMTRPATTHKPEANSKPASRRNQATSNRRAPRDKQIQSQSSPIRILARPQGAKREQSPNLAATTSSRNSSRSRSDSKAKIFEPPKAFQPQILRRSQNLDHLLPVRNKDSQESDQQDAPPASSSGQETTRFDRHPSQNASQKEALLSLFGKPQGTSDISSLGELNIHTSVQKPAIASSVVSPLSPGTDVGIESRDEERDPRNICARCLNQNRAFSTTIQACSQQTSHAIPSPPPAGYARLTNRSLISITGVDSVTFLQGLITQNMLITNDPNRATRRTGSYTAFLNSHGRILNDAFIYPFPQTDGASPDEPGWLIEVDKNEVTSLMKHLKKHKLRAKLKLRALEDGERTVWASWKDHAEPRWAAYNLESSTSSPFPSSSTMTGCVDTRAPGFGTRLITPGVESLRTHVPDETEVVGSETSLGAYTVRRMLHGIAEGQSEIIRESALPLEYNMDMMRGIDFRKGCYVGQELTIRTHHTGVVRKRVLPVQLYSGDQTTLPAGETPLYDPSTDVALPPSGSNISKISARKGRSAGKFLGGIGNIGLALCRLEMMTDITLTGEGTQYSPEQEFKVSWTAEEGSSDQQGSGETKIKALVPPWTRDYISSGGVQNNNRSRGVEGGHRAREFLEQLEEEESQRQ
ncbi:hypothetical protein BDV25DRAFT_130781 [Aspergillus avenaceus]|uniref:Iron-sulfur cluster assembly factor IBA57 homolog, mitochondrial n=1 Tax=Aspergillus avenaceus TaxID=36643 RepID=A0A5N6TRH8_ASPAV|nr:hypothetical protein BDV25DRAFT_130781 [Aspergillus avenaceus]